MTCLRIGLISPLYESVPPRLYGGTERVIYGLARGLAEAGHEVTLYASGDSRARGCRLVPVVDEALRLRSRPANDPHAYTLRMMQMVSRDSADLDVIHNHHDYWMLPLSEMTDTPFVSTLHGRLDLPDISAAFLSFPRANYVSISDAQRGPLSLLRWVRTVHNGIDVDALRFQPRPGAYLAFLGRIFWDKRPDLAIRIAKQAGIPLKIAAKIEGPESQAYFDAHVRPHVDGRNVEYLGEIGEREKDELLGGALGLVFPIDWPEPFGLVMAESLACGTPVLARPLGAVPELLRDGVTGFASLDPDQLARRVADLERIDRAGCRRWAEERFSLRRMTEDYIDVYRSLTGTGRVARSVGGGRAGRHRRHLLHSV
jgi:glycosyltransferase involved in cell wall biosynthesis